MLYVRLLISFLRRRSVTIADVSMNSAEATTTNSVIKTVISEATIALALLPQGEEKMHTSDDRISRRPGCLCNYSCFNMGPSFDGTLSSAGRIVLRSLKAKKSKAILKINEKLSLVSFCNYSCLLFFSVRKKILKDVFCFFFLS